jgi:hypothetical protein
MAVDFITDDKRNLLIEDGDFVLNNSDSQHVEDLMISDKGTFYQSPISGIGIIRQLKSPKHLINKIRVENEISIQLLLDGATNIDIDYNEQIEVSATYE